MHKINIPTRFHCAFIFNPGSAKSSGGNLLVKCVRREFILVFNHLFSALCLQITELRACFKFAPKLVDLIGKVVIW